MKTTKSIGIIGFGRFGQLLAEYAKTRYRVNVVELDESKQPAIKAAGFNNIKLSELGSVDYIFLAVPISSFEETIKQLAPIVKPNQVVIDLCSVKVFPVQVMKQYLDNCQILATHPMFGPDSAKLGLKGLKVAFCPISVAEENLNEIRDLWQEHGAQVVITTPEKHDQDTVYSQAFTYIMARAVNDMDLPAIEFDTRSYKDIVEVARLSAKDSQQLFHDMLYYNPNLKPMLAKLEKATSSAMVGARAIATKQT